MCSCAHYVNRMWIGLELFFLFWVGCCLRLVLGVLAFGFALLRYASADLLFGGVVVLPAGWFWGEIVAMSVNSVNGVMWEISEIEGSYS